MLRSMLVFALVIGGCEVFRQSDIVPGRLILSGDTANIQIPDTVIRGIPFEVVVETFGGVELFGGRCFSDVPAATIVDVHPSRVSITLYDLVYSGGDCTDDVRLIRHVATVTLDVIGPVIFRFIETHGPLGPHIELHRIVVSVAP